MMTLARWIFGLGLLLGLLGCQQAEGPPVETPVVKTEQPTAVAQLPAATPELPPTATSIIPSTFTPAATQVEKATIPPFTTFTPAPSQTPWPTRTATPPPSATPAPTLEPSQTPLPVATLAPSATPIPQPVSANLLPNPSFEDGWYHIDSRPEFQVPNRWRLEWREGENSLDPDPWNRFVPPESRVINKPFLPPEEHPVFVWDGEYTVKIFKGQGAINFKLLTTLPLDPGTYRFETYIYPDLYEAFENGQKIWASDPLSGEVQLWTNGQASSWQLPTFGQRNFYTQTFTVNSSGTVEVGIEVRGRWAILNNGWFMDDWALYQVN